MRTDLKGKWVLITGASSGFGAATALSFGSEGSKLLLGARRIEKLEQVATQATNRGASEVHIHPLDVSTTDSVNAFVSWAKDRISSGTKAKGRGKSSPAGEGETPKLDILINNAGGAHGADPVLNGKDEDWETMMQTNVLGVLRMTRAALPLMLNNPGSSILNIGSVAGHISYEGGAAYCAAKAGELQITRALRLELNGTGIRVGTIDPGLAETEFSLVRFKGDAARAKKVYEGTHPLNAEDIADIVVWVASRPSHVNIDEVIVKPVDQADVYKIYRRKT
jgi:NADP-dependent 3-hydroxy acid dehydrogenase YdfG